MSAAGFDRTIDLLRRRLGALHERIEADAAHGAEEPTAPPLATAPQSETDAAEMRTVLDEISQRVAALSDAFASFATGVRERDDAIAQKLASILASSDSRPLYRPTLRGGRDDVIASLIDGLLVAVPAEELRLALYHAFYGFQEPGTRKVFGTLVKPGNTVLDVGASIGMYSLCAARLVGEAGSVLAFEPTPRTFSVLVENLKFNGFWDNGLVRAYRIALGEAAGTSRFYCYPGDFGFNTRYRRDEGGDEIAVEVATFDELFPDLRVDVVKIDAEGSERAVLAGMAKTIERNAQISIIMEFAPSHLVRAEVEPNGFAKELIECFDVAEIDVSDGSLRPASVEELGRAFSVNLLLTRRTDRTTHA